MQILYDIVERRFKGAGAPKQVFEDERIQKEFIKQLQKGQPAAFEFICKLLAECIAASVKYELPIEAGIVECIVHQDKFNPSQVLAQYKEGKIKRHATLIESVMVCLETIERLVKQDKSKYLLQIAESLEISPNDDSPLVDEILCAIGNLRKDRDSLIDADKAKQV